MSVKVKRGLGLLVISGLSLIVGLVIVQATDGTDGGPLIWALLIVAIVAGLTFWASLLGGLVMLAWGLLRE